MNATLTESAAARRIKLPNLAVRILPCLVACLAGCLLPGVALAQTDGAIPQVEDMTPSDSLPRTSPENAGDNVQPDTAAQNAVDTVDPVNNGTVVREKGLNLLNLLSRGGWFMIPLGILSIVVVALGIERTLALREQKMLPQPFVRELGALSRSEEGFDPRLAFRTCQQYPSAAARVMRVMLLKAGRPQSEIDHAVSEASQREANRLQAPVSWLTLVAAVAPLIGLLGTVWGMIQAFYDTTQLVAGQNKAEVLAQGIYTALVTTLSGLIIAIPAAVLAHFFDNRIVAWFYRIEEMAASLSPMLEPFEGQVRSGVSADPNVARPPRAAATAPADMDGNAAPGTRRSGTAPR